MILSVCDSPDVLKVIRIIRMVIMIIQIVVPLILIVTGMKTFVKAVTDSKDGLPESLKIFTKKAIIAVVIFLVPVIVNFILSVVAPDMDITVCFQNATSEKIEAKYIEHMEMI